LATVHFLPKRYTDLDRVRPFVASIIITQVSSVARDRMTAAPELESRQCSSQRFCHENGLKKALPVWFLANSGGDDDSVVLSSFPLS
jgi:hypothetical protein